MLTNPRDRLRLAALGAAGVLLLSGSAILAVGSAPPPVIYTGCLNKTTGIPYNVAVGTVKLHKCLGSDPTISWNNVGPQGETGATGAAGAKGADGATGATGDTGTAGPKGDTGAAGAAGSNGTDGADGAKGDTGARGDPGATGAAGTDGATGAAGTNGTDGATGPKGDKGDAGAAGSASLAALDGTLCDVGTTGGTVHIWTDPTNGEVFMRCGHTVTVSVNHPMTTLNITTSIGSTDCGHSADCSAFVPQGSSLRVTAIDSGYLVAVASCLGGMTSANPAICYYPASFEGTPTGVRTDLTVTFTATPK